MESNNVASGFGGKEIFRLRRLRTKITNAMNVVCVALIGKKNNPLYIRSTTEDPDDLTYTYMVHRYVT